MKTKIPVSFIFAATIFLNMIVCIPLLFILVTDYSWRNILFGSLFSGFIGLIALLSLYLLGKLKLLRQYRQIWTFFIFYICILGFISSGILLFVYSLHEPNLCEGMPDSLELTNRKERPPIGVLTSPDKSKQLVICDYSGPSGIQNIRIHYLLLSLIRRDLALNQDRLVSGLYI